MRALLLVLAAAAGAACSSGGAAMGNCTPLTCAQLGASCGAFDDGCGNRLACGTCSSGTCGGGGVPGVCAAPLCTVEGWCWANPQPLGTPLFGLAGLAANDLWAVGPAGTILHFDGTRWSLDDAGGDYTLQDVFPASASDVWAVGSPALILHRVAGAWQSIASNASKANAILRSVWGASGTSIWTVGSGGTILHYDGGSWSPQPSGTANDLYSVWGSGPADVYAVGAMGAALHSDGQTWSPSTWR